MNDKDREGHDFQSCRKADTTVEERRFSAAITIAPALTSREAAPECSL
jgi:hypothetical protein